MKIAAAYIRVSTHYQEELSPDAQKRLIIDYAKSHDMIISNDYIFLDSGISGRTAQKRPAFMRMIELAKSKPSPFDVILIWKFSRFARNQEESIVYKSLLRKQCNVEVVSITEPTTGDMFGGLIERIIEWMDEFYSIRLAEDVTRGMTEKALRGGYQASPPLGYTIMQKGKPPVIVHDQAAIVQDIFKTYASTSMGFYEVAKYMNSLGYRTKSGSEFEARGIKYILENPMYKGYLRWNRTKNSTNEIKPEDEWIVRKGDFEAIVSEELWQEANDKINKEYRPKGSRPVSRHRHWLSGLVKCSNCGRSLSTSTYKDKRYGHIYTNFQCYGYLKGKCSISHQISERKLVPIILDILKEDMAQKDITFERIASKPDNKAKELLLDQLSKTGLKEQRIKEAYRNGIDTLEEYQENKEILRKERLELEEKLKSLEVIETSHSENMSEKIHDIYDILVSNDFDMADKQRAIRSIVKKIVYNKKDGTVDLYYYQS
jgi:DNA invertase Pin-like site-specific DNA recombinase